MLVRFFNACLWGFAICIFCFVWGFLVEPNLLKTRHLEICSSEWLGEPMKIVFLSDIHIGGEHVPPSRVSSIVSRVNAEKADLVLIGGDFIDGHTHRTKTSNSFNTKIDTGLRALKEIMAPLGVISVIGNHDVWYDEVYVSKFLQDQGMTILSNDAVNVKEDVCIVGLADDMTQEPDNAAYKLCQTSDNIIALMHSPDSFGLMYSNTNLALAGHTHGGQINLPFLGRAVTPTRSGSKYAYGQVEHNGIPTFITAGIGTSILPARFRSPPEIVVITLRSSEP